MTITEVAFKTGESRSKVLKLMRGWPGPCAVGPAYGQHVPEGDLLYG